MDFPIRFGNIRPFQLGLFAILAVGCGPTSPQKDSQVSVYGGRKVATGLWPNVVAITEEDTGIYCSGTAVTPKLVITAAHCAIGFEAHHVSVYVGEGKEGGYVDGQHVVDRLKPSPRYDRLERGAHDIAYVLLSTPLDLPARAYIPVLSDPDEKKELLAVGHKGHIVGFGDRSDGGYGLKFEGDGRITSVNKLEVSLGGDGVDSCQGDSGGPVFGKLRSGEWRVYGVTSRGEDCGTGGIYGIMSSEICWIQKDSGVKLDLAEGTCD